MAGRSIAALLLAVAATGCVGQTSATSDGAAPVASPAFRLAAHTVPRKPAKRAFSKVDWSGGRFAVSGGQAVSVFVSQSYDASVGRHVADYLDSLVHGAELASLSAYVATPTEVASLCEAEAFGCYGGDSLVVAGEVVDGVSPEEVIAHEYGHHIASHRLNTPWPAIDWGTKRWASYANVCTRAEARAVFPGDQDRWYQLNPGEAFAEVYRVLNERRLGKAPLGWSLVDQSFYPDSTSLDLVARDVLDPWIGPRRLAFAAKLPRGRRAWTTSIETPLDGDLSVTLRLARGGAASLQLVDAAGRVVARGLWSAANRISASTRVCGARSLRVRVAVNAGSRFSLAVVVP